MEKQIPLTKHLETRGAAADLSRRFGITANAVSIMHKTRPCVFVVFREDGTLALREDKILYEEQLPEDPAAITARRLVEIDKARERKKEADRVAAELAERLEHLEAGLPKSQPAATA